MAKRVFVKGELLGTFGTKFVEELPQETVGKKKRRMCICECGICHNLYTTQLRMDKKDWYCTDCSVKNLKEKRTKKHYVEGQILNNDTKSTLVKLTTSHHSDQYGIVKCGMCGKEYETKLSIVENGAVCKQCHMNKMHNASKRYYPGDVITSVYGIDYLFEKETEPVIYKSRVSRYGYFIQLDKDGKKIGEPFYAQLGHIISGSCNGNDGMSSGERAFANVLDILGITYTREYIFDDLLSKKGYPLRFDFMIPFEKNKKLLAELDGEQHYHPMDYYNGEEGYQTLHSHDIAKNTYVLQHEELVLVRIPYYDYKKIDTEYVKNILTKYINIKFERGVEK